MDNTKGDMVVKRFEGTVLFDRFLVGPVLGQGNFGTVHQVVDQKYLDQKAKHVVKCSRDIATLYNEVKALDQIHQYASLDNFKY